MKVRYHLDKQFPQVYYKDMEVQAIGARRSQYVRNAFNPSMKERFREASLETCLVVPFDFDEYQIHHVLPVSLGGRNEPDNLAMVEPFIHKQIHKYINKQCIGLEKGDKCKIRIPYYLGKVWGPLP